MNTYTVNSSDAKHVWFASDTHFDHTNIIRYCGRPFEDTEQMNQVMVQSWNAVVRPVDTVFFLGDIAHGRSCRPSYWWNQLNGRKHLIYGNHDRGCGVRGSNVAILNIGARSVLLIHDPWLIPPTWKGWVIYGHKHDKTRHIDESRKRICVSMEQIDYTPISLAQILDIMNRANSVRV